MLIDAIETLFPDFNFNWDRRGPYAKGYCPLHKNTHTPAFAVYVDAKGRDKWHCFAENIGGNLLDLVRLSGIPGTESIPGANNWLLKKGYLQETAQQKIDRERNEALHRFYRWTNDLLCNSPQAAGVRAYIARRHINTDTLPLAALGYYPSLQEVRAWVVENNLSEILEQEVCVSEAKNLQVSGSLIFFYKNSYSEISRLKVRNVANEKGKEKKTFFLGSKIGSKTSMGFFSWFMNCTMPDKAVLVEGEFDVGTLSSLVYEEDPNKREPIYCFSGGGNIATGITTVQNMGIKNLYIFPDNDAAGIKYAQDIAEAFPDTFNLFPEDYKADADPSEWATKHTYADLEKAFENRRPAFMWIGQKLAMRYSDATIEERASIRAEIVDYGRRLSPVNRELFIRAFGSLSGVTFESIMQEIEEASAELFRKSLKPDGNFGIWMLAQKGKNKEWKHISNVILEHVQDTLLDDGSGDDNIKRCVTVRLITINQNKVINIDIDEFIDDKKLRRVLTEKLGAAAVLIEPKQEANLRNSMAALSSIAKGGEAGNVATVYYHTGWRDGRYYTPKGYIDEKGFHELEDVQVQLPDSPSYYSNYFLTDGPSDLTQSKKFIREEVLQVFPYKITLPYLSHIFWTVLSDFVPIAKPYCLWVVGQTGSFKTSYTGIMNSFFGDFKDQNFDTWRSTPNSLEVNGYYVKDMPFVIDDYKPVDCKKPDVTRLIQNYADRHGRSRMHVSKNSSYDRVWWIRGNMIVTAEDVPPEGETSITARTLELRVPSNGSSEHLTNAQAGAATLPGVMAKYIEFLCNKHLNTVELERELNTFRAQFPAMHARVRENLAVNALSWKYASEFLELQDLDKYYKEGINLILANMNQATAAQQAGAIIVDTIRSLLYSGKHHLEGMGGYPDTPHAENSVRLGWIDEEGVYLIGNECIAEVNKMRMQITGSGINYTARTIYDQLAAMGYIIVDPKTGKNSTTKRINGFIVRVIKLKRGVVEEEQREEARDKIESQTAVIRDPRSNTGKESGN